MKKEQYLEKWIELKEAEEQLKEERKFIEKQLMFLYEVPEGQKSKTFDDNGFKIEVKESEIVTIDQVEAEYLFGKYDAKILPFKREYKLDSAKYKSLKDFEEDFYNMCSKAVTIKPGSISVKVTKKE